MDNIWEFLNPKKEKKVLKCVVCGKEVSEDRFHYNYKHGLCCCSDECFTKQFWQDALKDAIIINQHSYHLGNENDSEYCRGMDGRAYKIQLDNGDIYYTTNLWYNGKVPKEYYKGDNARFIR